LDEFVGKYTATGHTGNYLKDNFVRVVAHAGYETIKRETIVHPWVFLNEDHLFNWMSKFFGLSTISKKTLLYHVENILGINKGREVLTVNWELFFFFAQTKKIPLKFFFPRHSGKTFLFQLRAGS